MQIVVGKPESMGYNAAQFLILVFHCAKYVLYCLPAINSVSGCKALSWVNIYYIVNMSSENSLHRNLKSRSVLSGQMESKYHSKCEKLRNIPNMMNDMTC